VCSPILIPRENAHFSKSRFSKNLQSGQNLTSPKSQPCGGGGAEIFCPQNKSFSITKGKQKTMAPRTFMSLKPGMPKPAIPASKAAAPAAPGALAGKKPATTAAGEKADASLAETPQKTIVPKAKNIRGKPADSSAAQALDATASPLPPSKPAGALIAKKKENEAPDNLETVTTSPAPHTTLPDDTGSTRAEALDDQQDTTATKEDGTPCVSSKKAHGKGFGGSLSDVPNKVEVTKRAVKPLAIKAKTTVPAAKETGAERLAAIVGPSKGDKKVR
jgi:hypothetical protein